MPEPREIFERIDPPPGGLPRLRERLARERRRRAYRTQATLAFASAAALALVFFFVRTAGDDVRRHRDAPEQLDDVITLSVAAGHHPGLIGLGLYDGPTEPVSVRADRRHELAVKRVPTESQEVIFYLVASTASSPPPLSE